MEQKLIDLHCDTLSCLLRIGDQENIRENHLWIDLKEMRRAGTLAEFFACFVYAKEYENSPLGVWDAAYGDVLRMIERMEHETEDAKELCVVHNCREIEVQAEKGNISAILTVEEGGVLNGDMSRLEDLYKKGVRLMTLTWNYENCIGYPNSKNQTEMERSLKPFGIEVVHRMNELGMLIDVSHLSDGGFWDCIQCSKAPIVASHSNARALCAHPRNLSDEMLKALAEKGGVTGLNFYPAFLRADETEVTLQDLARHALHIIQTAGEDVLAIGTDFDGFDMPELKAYISHFGEMEGVWDCMKSQGITERQLDKIWSGNALRVMREIM